MYTAPDSLSRTKVFFSGIKYSLLHLVNKTKPAAALILVRQMPTYEKLAEKKKEGGREREPSK